jgi:hypothetical protein
MIGMHQTQYQIEELRRLLWSVSVSAILEKPAHVKVLWMPARCAAVYMHSACGDAPNCPSHLSNTNIARYGFEYIGDQQFADFGAKGGCVVA